MTALPVTDAARSLGIRPGTLRRWVREGCPVVRHGHRGRAKATLVDPEQVRQWRSAGERERVYLEIAGAVPEVLAQAAAESLRLADGIDKRALAGVLAGSWYVASTAVLDHLRQQAPAVPELTEIPERIAALRKIAR